MGSYENRAAEKFGGGKTSAEDMAVNKAAERITQRIVNPANKQDYIDRLKVIAEMGQTGYSVEATANDWKNYGKDRTYLKINAYRDSDGKLHHEQDFGYIDNMTGKYIRKNKNNDLQSDDIFKMSGSKPDKEELSNAIKKVAKKKI